MLSREELASKYGSCSSCSFLVFFQLKKVVMLMLLVLLLVPVDYSFAGISSISQACVICVTGLCVPGAYSGGQ